MSLMHGELDAFVGQNIFFDSHHGSITVYGIRHPMEHMSGITDVVMITADSMYQEITFTNSSNTFRQLRARAMHGINAEQDINTTDGHLELIFYHGNLDLSEDVDIIAQGGDVILTSLDGTLFLFLFCESSPIVLLFIKSIEINDLFFIM